MFAIAWKPRAGARRSAETTLASRAAAPARRMLALRHTVNALAPAAPPSGVWPRFAPQRRVKRVFSVTFALERLYLPATNEPSSPIYLTPLEATAQRQGGA